MNNWQEFIEGKSIEEVEALVNEYGLDVSVEQIKVYFNGEDVELSLDDLEKVSGGTCPSCC
ncbi:MAG: hypothetical protein IJ737_01910 [Ruminococcus sp.]|nr:hypothetical protein [Ruminococcus sp.]